MDIARITISGPLLADIRRVTSQKVSDFVHETVAHALATTYRNDLVGAKAAERRAAGANLPTGRTKLPDAPEVREGKSAYRLLVHMMETLRRGNPDKWKPFAKKLDDALRSYSWAQIVEWRDRGVLVMKQRTPEEAAWQAEQIGS